MPTPHHVTSALALFTLSLTANAQDHHWRIPAGAAVIYERTQQVTGTETDKGKKPRRITLREPNYTPPVFFHAELDDKQQHLTQPVHFLCEIPMHLAVDLRHTLRTGDRVIDMPATAYFKPFRIEAHYQPMGPNGTQRIIATVEGDDEDCEIPGTWGQRLDVQMQIDRRFDVDKGHVVSFDVKASWQYRDVPGKGHRHAKVEHTEHCKLLRIEQRGEATFAQRVQQGIDRGVAYLLKELEKPLADRGWALGKKPKNKDADQWFGPGYRALTLLTLIKAGVPKDHPTLVAALEDLRKLNITESYSLSCALMAMEAYYAPDAKHDKPGKRGKHSKPKPHKLPRRDKRIVQEWTNRLLHNHDVDVDKAYQLRFRYHHAGGYDNSVSQYAMLGLYSARRCGAKISPQVWFAAAEHWLEQAIETDDTPMHVKIHGPGHQATAGKGRTEAQLPATRPCRWGYYKQSEPSASMTTAGITGVTVCLGALREGKRGPKKLRSSLEERLRGGFGWLSRNFSMRAVLGNSVRYVGVRAYYWFGLARVMELNQVELLAGRDWYFEGAQIMLGRQYDCGSWGGIDDTCFCILFLKKAVSGPIVPIYSRPITPGKGR